MHKSQRDSKPSSIADLLKMIKESISMIKESISFPDIIKISRTDFPSCRDPNEPLEDGSKTIVWIEKIHGEYNKIQLIFFLQSPDNPLSIFSFPKNTVTVRVVQNPPGTNEPPGTIGGTSLREGALLAEETFDTAGFKTIDIIKPTTDTLVHIQYIQNAGEPLLSDDRPKIMGMRMELSILAKV